jgi:hypothetical protein
MPLNTMAEVIYKPILELFEPVDTLRLQHYVRIGYRVVTARPGFDTGLGPCGKYICSCESSCELEENKQ